jgi:uncharacterized protein YdbL (DUF1318 family)
MRRLLLVFALIPALAAGPLAAQTAADSAAVAAAKTQGLVGEQADGFLGLVAGSAPPSVKAAMDDINAGRAKAYADIAAKTGVTAQAAGEATARQLFARLPSGQYYKPLGGAWARK